LKEQEDRSGLARKGRKRRRKGEGGATEPTAVRAIGDRDRVRKKQKGAGGKKERGSADQSTVLQVPVLRKIERGRKSSSRAHGRLRRSGGIQRGGIHWREAKLTEYVVLPQKCRPQSRHAHSNGKRQTGMAWRGRGTETGEEEEGPFVTCSFLCRFCCRVITRTAPEKGTEQRRAREVNSPTRVKCHEEGRRRTGLGKRRVVVCNVFRSAGGAGRRKGYTGRRRGDENRGQRGEEREEINQESHEPSSRASVCRRSNRKKKPEANRRQECRG